MNLKKFVILFSIICIDLFSINKADQEKPFVVIIPSYNNSKWYKENLDSVFNQKYNNYRIIYIDDHSSDSTGNLVENYIRLNNKQHCCTLIKNKQRRLKMANMYNAIYTCDDNEIIIILDGDDSFAHENVIQRINQEYQNNNEVWVTYGSYCYKTPGRVSTLLPPFCYKIPNDLSCSDYRTSDDVMVGSTPGHPFSFYSWLFKKIDYKDFLYKASFVPMAPDGAIVWPIIEQAWYNARFIPEILCIYNDTNELSEYKVNSELQSNVINSLKSKTPYKPLNDSSIIKNQRTTDLILFVIYNNYNNISALINVIKQSQTIRQLFIMTDSKENMESIKYLRKKFPEYYVLDASDYYWIRVDQLTQRYMNRIYDINSIRRGIPSLITSCLAKSPSDYILFLSDNASVDTITRVSSYIENNQNILSPHMIFLKKIKALIAQTYTFDIQPLDKDKVDCWSVADYWRMLKRSLLLITDI